MRNHTAILTSLLLTFLLACSQRPDAEKAILKNSRIAFVGNNLCSRMMNFGSLETMIHLRFPDSTVFIRNLCDPGNTAGFQPHSARKSPWAFPGADRFQSELAQESGSDGHFETPDEWMYRLKVDMIIAFFGYNESFAGEAGLERFKEELEAYLEHTSSQKYNGISAPNVILVSPIAFQDLSHILDLPNGKKENANLSLYTGAMKEISNRTGTAFIDVFTSTRKWFSTGQILTIDGSQLNEAGYSKLSKFLTKEIFGNMQLKSLTRQKIVNDAVNDKNWFWHNDYKMPNGVHAFGRRHNPFGPDNYPAEIQKIREMTIIRDSAIWAAAKGGTFDVDRADKRTTPIPPVKTNYSPPDGSKNEPAYLYGENALERFTLAPGYKIELFASEEEFPDLANPVQLSFDNKGRLWVAVMPSYPHYKPGDSKPNDKLIILEDTNSDGKADKQTTFVDGLHLPIGFEFAPEGVYVSQSPHLKLFTDTDGDDRADKAEIVISGFDDHDTHHAISAFCADPSGAIYMAEGVFLHTNVETSYGPVRATNGGFYRFNPTRRHLERTAQLSIPNPWGIAFDEWGQNFFAETSGPDVLWMMPGTIKPRYGMASPKSVNLIEGDHRVRPTSGLEFIYSRHFPNEVQGDLLINNTIGFLGTKQHTFKDDGTGYTSRHRHDLVQSSDPNFRPVDMEFAPDGSLYLIDWHNMLIGHMQHNARDPLRDHVHGRVYRVTYPARPLVTPAQVSGASLQTLLDNLMLPEYRTRYRSRRELRGRDAEKVMVSLGKWVDNLNSSDGNYEHHLLEALWVQWGLNRIEEPLLRRLLQASDFRVRAAAVRAIRYNGHLIDDPVSLLAQASGDDHGRVRLEVITTASWQTPDIGLKILAEVAKSPLDPWMLPSFRAARAHLQGQNFEMPPQQLATNLQGEALQLFIKGKEVYEKEGFCGTCHQNDGLGLEASGFPPLARTPWVNGDVDRLIKLTLNGLYGPLKVLDVEYPGQVPMTPFRGLLSDQEIAAVLTYVRNSFGNDAATVSPQDVQRVRETTSRKTGFYTAAELLREHPLQKEE